MQRCADTGIRDLASWRSRHQPLPPPKNIMDISSIARIAGALACSSVAMSAQNLNVSLEAVSPSQTFSGSFTGAGGFAPRIAGVLDFDYAGAFCVEPLQSVSGTVNYEIQPNGSLANSASIAKVVGAYLQSSKTNEDAAAAQWAIWEIVGDGILNPSFSNGNTQINRSDRSVTAAKALFYLNNLSNYPSASFVYATHPTSQDVIFMIPEPSGLLLGALGITSLLIRRRR